jgi:glycosyltransferase involved in cell wall biosynthesis
MAHSPKTLLIFSQVFLPDPASVGQHMADVAIAMRRRGHRVVVYASNRGYEDPNRHYLARETIEGVEVRRLKFSSFGKASIPKRLIGTISFMVQCFFIALTSRHVDGILFSTSPPMVGFVVSLAAMMRRIPTAYWAMDLNPDQLIALGKINRNGLASHFLQRINRFILQRTSLVVALDRFMAGRLKEYARLESKMVVIAPWPHEHHLHDVPRSENPFVIRHNLLDRFVIMYSGNHSPSNPLDTLLQATLRFRDDPRIRFLFVGGGLGKRDVERFIAQHSLTNVVSLPYQPLADLSYSLSAADVHVVSLGEQMVGIIHPCKIYGAMTVGRPVLFFGPSPSHVSDLLTAHDFGWTVAHGDVEQAVRAIRYAADSSEDKRRTMGQTALQVMRQQLTQELLCGQFCQALEEKLQLAAPSLDCPAKEPAPCEPCLS